MNETNLKIEQHEMLQSEIDAFLSNGGIVIKCPPCVSSGYEFDDEEGVEND
jgi:hypothetical protein